VDVSSNALDTPKYVPSYPALVGGAGVWAAPDIAHIKAVIVVSILARLNMLRSL
jgi:hypothetical protein